MVCAICLAERPENGLWRKDGPTILIRGPCSGGFASCYHCLI